MDLDDAIELARQAHCDQTDAAGEPYLGHLLRVLALVRQHQREMGRVLSRPGYEDEEASVHEQMVAVLHDIIEDTPITEADLAHLGCPPEVHDAVVAMTHRDGEHYEAYIARLAANELAASVKRFDMADNSDDSRLAQLTPERRRHFRQKYDAGREYLQKWVPYWHVRRTVAAHPDGAWSYWATQSNHPRLLRTWGGDAARGAGQSWPERLEGVGGDARWVPGSSYDVDALSGRSDDPWSAGEDVRAITLEEAADLAVARGAFVDAPTIEPPTGREQPTPVTPDPTPR